MLNLISVWSYIFEERILTNVKWSIFIPSLAMPTSFPIGANHTQKLLRNLRIGTDIWLSSDQGSTIYSLGPAIGGKGLSLPVVKPFHQFSGMYRRHSSPCCFKDVYLFRGCSLQVVGERPQIIQVLKKKDGTVLTCISQTGIYTQSYCCESQSYWVTVTVPYLQRWIS